MYVTQPLEHDMFTCLHLEVWYWIMGNTVFPMLWTYCPKIAICNAVRFDNPVSLFEQIILRFSKFLWPEYFRQLRCDSLKSRCEWISNTLHMDHLDVMEIICNVLSLKTNFMWMIDTLVQRNSICLIPGGWWAVLSQVRIKRSGYLDNPFHRQQRSTSTTPSQPTIPSAV